MQQGLDFISLNAYYKWEIHLSALSTDECTVYCIACINHECCPWNRIVNNDCCFWTTTVINQWSTNLILSVSNMQLTYFGLFSLYVHMTVLLSLTCFSFPQPVSLGWRYGAWPLFPVLALPESGFAGGFILWKLMFLFPSSSQARSGRTFRSNLLVFLSLVGFFFFFFNGSLFTSLDFKYLIWQYYGWNKLKYDWIELYLWNTLRQRHKFGLSFCRDREFKW